MAHIAALDSTFLKLFIENHVEDFTETLKELLKDHPVDGRAISYIAEGDLSNTTISAKKPLILGLMVGEGGIAGGPELNKIIQEAAAELDRVITDQSVLFEDLEQALWDTIEILKKTQGGNLEKITPEDFMDIFEDVDSDFGNSGGGEDER